MSTPEQAEPVAGDAFAGRYEIVAPISSEKFLDAVLTRHRCAIKRRQG